MVLARVFVTVPETDGKLKFVTDHVITVVRVPLTYPKMQFETTLVKLLQILMQWVGSNNLRWFLQ